MDPTDRLLAWYRSNRRELPWRRRRDPYAIWVSEVMLQQTRVETVKPYYEAFLERFPTVRELAAASEDEVLALWSGLGYYRRARQLAAAARRIVAAGGELPGSPEALERLPGIGPYTAAAVASIAFDVPAPVLDGNVERVLSRYLASRELPKSAAGRRRLLRLAGELMDERRPGDFNQALMELGARLCTPRRPDCPACPLAAGCAARAEGEPERYPIRRPPAPPVRRQWVAVLARSGGALLMSRRPATATLMAGMWELPWVEAGGEPESDLARRYGGRWRLGARRGEVRHSITNRRILVGLHEARWEPDEVGEPGTLAWVEESRMEETPASSLVAKALRVAARATVAS